MLRNVFPPYNTRQLSWDDAVQLATTLKVPVERSSSRHDAYLVQRFSGPRIIVSSRVHPPTWGVFCVVHELAHSLVHPGPREFYLGSPGWLSHVETQANLIAWLALAPAPLDVPLPRILRIETLDGLVRFTVGAVVSRDPEFGGGLRSRQISVQRYTVHGV